MNINFKEFEFKKIEKFVAEVEELKDLKTFISFNSE
jgi:hypothetical protein